MFNMFKKSKNRVEKPQKYPEKVRRFTSAGASPNHNWKTSYNKINADLKSDYIALTLRSRSLIQNNQTVNAYINLMLRSTLGNTGFILNCEAHNEDGSTDSVANEIIEKHWNEFNKSFKKYVSADHQMNGLDFDRHVLFNYLVDGEVFIRKVKDSTSPYSVRFQVIDSLMVDPLYNVTNGKDKICMGVKVDEHYRPLSYFVRKNNSTDYYTTGERIEIPASEIIHIYKKNFADQIRGYTPLAPVLLSLNSLEEYKNAEISAAILNSCFMGVWTKNSSGGENYSDYTDDDVDENGDIATVVENGVFRFAPDNCSLQQITSQHPSSNITNFFKAMLKGVAGCLGMSYNKLSSDYQSTSYSSLRQSNMEDEVTIKELQRFFIDNFKSIQYAQWLKFLLLSDMTNLPYSKFQKFLQHEFQGRSFEFLDPQKALNAIQTRLQLGLSSPIEQILALGKNPEVVLDQIKKWNEMLKQRNLKVADSLNIIVDQLPEGKEEEEEI